MYLIKQTAVLAVTTAPSLALLSTAAQADTNKRSSAATPQH